MQSPRQAIETSGYTESYPSKQILIWEYFYANSS